jgi:hypothetical protein
VLDVVSDRAADIIETATPISIAAQSETAASRLFVLSFTIIFR